MREPLRKIPFRPGLVITTGNRKGGTGKSSITVNLAGELVLRGYHVGIIDTDSQVGNASYYLGLEREDGLFRAVVGDENGKGYAPVDLADVVRVVPADSYYAAPVQIIGKELYLLETDPNDPEDYYPIGSLYIIPSGEKTFTIPVVIDDVERFDEVCREFIERFGLDFVFVDTAPTVTLFDGSIYRATDAFLYVTEPESGSLVGLSDAIAQAERVAKRQGGKRAFGDPVLGIVPNKVRALREHRKNLDNLRETFGDAVWADVRQLKLYSQSTSVGQTVRAFSNSLPEAYEIIELVDRFENVIAQRLGVNE